MKVEPVGVCDLCKGPIPPGDWWTPAEIADAAGVSVMTAYNATSGMDQLYNNRKLPGKDGATYQEIADAAGVGVATVWRVAHDGQLFHLEKLPGKDGLTLFT